MASLPPEVSPDVVSLTSQLLRIDTSNSGEAESTVGERIAAEWVAGRLSELGIDYTFIEPAHRRSNVIARVPGTDAKLPALMVHCHLDTVPADPGEWSHHPLSGAVEDGYVWGRGAVDMKYSAVVSLCALEELKRNGRRPRRDLVLAFLADEEAGGRFGAHWLVHNRPDVFEGVSEAVGEVGGFSVTLNDGVRAYLIQTAEKGFLCLRLLVEGAAGHGSMVGQDNAVAKLAAAVTRLEAYEFPTTLMSPASDFLAGVSEMTGIPLDPSDPDQVIARLGALSRMIEATTRHTANTTMLTAGYKPNVIPSRAEAVMDCRFLPGLKEDFLARVYEVVDRETVHEVVSGPAVSTDFNGALVDSMIAALEGEDPGARVLPYMFSGGTDAKSFQALGIRCFGFAPLRLPGDLDFAALFHGVDERVPVEGLRFSVRAMRRFLESA